MDTETAEFYSKMSDERGAVMANASPNPQAPGGVRGGFGEGRERVWSPGKIRQLRVELLPGIAQQAAVSCVLHQRVPEGIDRLGRRAALGDQLGADEAGERGLQLFLGETRNRTQ